DPSTSWYGAYGRYNGLATQLTLLALGVIVATLPGDDSARERRAAVLVLTLLPVAAWTILQFLGFDPRPWPNPRPASTIGHPVPLAASLALVAPLAAAFVFAETDRAKRRTGAVVLATLVAAILLTLSRGPWAGAALALVFLAAWALKQRLVQGDRQLVIVLIVLACVGAIRVVSGDSGSLLRARFASILNVSDDPSFVNRFTYIDAGWRMFQLHPLRGTGFDHFGLLYPRYRGVEPAIVPIDQLPTKVHNGYLDRAIATGAPGLMLHLGLIGYVLFALWRRGHMRVPPLTDRGRLLAIALFAAIGGFLIQDLSGWEELPLLVYFWITLGLAVSVASAGDEARWRPSPHATRAIAAIAILVAAGMAWQATRSWRHLTAESALMLASSGDIDSDWPAVSRHLDKALRSAEDVAHYLDVAGRVLFRRFTATRDLDAYTRAATVFDRAIAIDGYDPYLLLHRLELEAAALQSKIVDEPGASAMRAAALVTAIDPNNATVHASLARFYLAAGRLEDALAANQRSHQLRPSQARTHLVDGDIYGAMGKLPEQVAAYRAALGGSEAALRPEVVRKYILALISAGDTAEAVTQSRAALDQAPTDVLLHNLLGVAYLEAREGALAADAFRRSLELDPQNATARQGLSEADRLRSTQP
ncbi:MAG TPA: O-antigen ligase family protein, partial [Vicinamibacterales bacterium]